MEVISLKVDMSKIKCLCIGDSLALPRPGVLFSETWPYKCQYTFSESIIFENRSQWAQTTSSLLLPNYLEFYQPEIVIIHLGIVDCAPRKIFENYTLKHNALLLKKIFKNILWKIFKNKYKTFTIVKKEQYEYNIRNYIERCKDNNVKKIILIPICPPAISFLKKNPKTSVDEYNSILKQLSNEYVFVDYAQALPNNSDAFYLDDGYHINNIGHDKIFEAISPIVKSIIDSFK